jgi:hypothetical protein
MKCAVVLGSSFIKTGLGIQKLIRGHSQPHREQGDLINLLSLFWKKDTNPSLGPILRQQLSLCWIFEQFNLHSLTLKMEARCSLQTSGSFCALRRYISVNSIFYSHHCENLKTINFCLFVQILKTKRRAHAATSPTHLYGRSVLVTGVQYAFPHAIDIVAGLGNRDYGRRGSSALTMQHPSIRKSWH